MNCPKKEGKIHYEKKKLKLTKNMKIQESRITFKIKDKRSKADNVESKGKKKF